MEELSGDKMEMPGEGLCFLGSSEVRLSHTLEEGISFQDETRSMQKPYAR